MTEEETWTENDVAFSSGVVEAKIQPWGVK